MSKRIWEINTERGFVCCVGYTTRQAIELILQKILLDEKQSTEQQKQKRENRKMKRLN